MRKYQEAVKQGIIWARYQKQCLGLIIIDVIKTTILSKTILLKWSLWTVKLVLDLISIKRLILFKSHNLTTNARSDSKMNFTIKNWARTKQASLILPLTCSNVYLSYRLTFASLDLINSLLARSRCLCFCVYLWPYSLVFFFIIFIFILLRVLISNPFPFSIL